MKAFMVWLSMPSLCNKVNIKNKNNKTEKGECMERVIIQRKTHTHKLYQNFDLTVFKMDEQDTPKTE